MSPARTLSDAPTKGRRTTTNSTAPGTRRVQIPVSGMTCRSCEVRVTRKLTAVPGVESATVSARNGRADVIASRDVDELSLHHAIRKAGYHPVAAQRRWISTDRQVWRDVAIGVVLTLGILTLAKLTGVSSLADSASSKVSSAGLFVVVLLGLAASLSTCAALVGGLVAAISASYAERNPDGTTLARLRPHLAFNAGRIVGFAALGGVLGALGSQVSLQGPALGAVMLVVAALMLLVGLQLTQVVPRLGSGLLPALPTALTRLFPHSQAGPRSYSDLGAFAAGAGSFFLPCGFTQAMQVYAVSTGSPVQAALVMGLFAVGTTPGLLAIGGVIASVRGPIRTRFFRIVGVLVLAFAAVNIAGASNAIAPGWADRLGGDVAPTSISSNVEVIDGVQVLHTTQDGNGYSPEEATVYAGMPVRWEITSEAMGCASALRVPALGIRANLNFGANEYNFTIDEPGTTDYSCAMGMFTGKIHTIEKPLPGTGVAAGGNQ